MELNDAEKLNDTKLDQISAAGNLSAGDYAKIGDALGKLICYYIDKFTPSRQKHLK